jgi:hypothetical protein
LEVLRNDDGEPVLRYGNGGQLSNYYGINKPH